MQIVYHRAQVLHRWTANKGRLTIGAVLVEFSLHDDTTPQDGMRSRLVECVSLSTNPDHSNKFKKRQLKRRAYEQVLDYFDGGGERENLFADDPDLVPDIGLSHVQEAELQAELRDIEREFAVVH